MFSLKFLVTLKKTDWTEIKENLWEGWNCLLKFHFLCFHIECWMTIKFKNNGLKKFDHLYIFLLLHFTSNLSHRYPCSKGKRPQEVHRQEWWPLSLPMVKSSIRGTIYERREQKKLVSISCNFKSYFEKQTKLLELVRNFDLTFMFFKSWVKLKDFKKWLLVSWDL